MKHRTRRTIRLFLRRVLFWPAVIVGVAVLALWSLWTILTDLLTQEEPEDGQDPTR